MILNVEVSVPILKGYLGLTDSQGNYEQTYNVPRNIDLTLYVQAITLDFDRTTTGLTNFDFCTSNSLELFF